MKTVKVKIDKKGNYTYETQGFVGDQCKTVQQVMIGIGQVSCERPTAESFQSQETPAYNELGINQNQ
jgi:hypothetical protein